MPVPTWVSEVKEREAAEERAKEEKRRREVQQLGESACTELRAEIEGLGWLPDGVRLVKCVSANVQPNNAASAGLHLDIGDGFEVIAWKRPSGYMRSADVVNVYSASEKRRELCHQEWTKDGFARALARAYELLEEERDQQMAAQEQQKQFRDQEEARRILRERLGAIREQATERLGRAFAATVLNLQGLDPTTAYDPWVVLDGRYTSMPLLKQLNPPRVEDYLANNEGEPVAAFKKRLEEATEQAAANARTLVAIWTEAKALRDQAKALSVLDRDIKVYRVSYPRGVVLGEAPYVDTATVYTLTPEPAPDGFWPTVVGDEIKPVRVMNVHGSIEVEELVFKKGASLAELPYAIVLWDELRGEHDAANASYQRLSRAVAEVANGN